MNGGENADGFGMKEASGTGNKFIGCRAWENADDGYDFYAWIGTVKLENCWAYRSARNASFTGSDSDGNGFKLGGDNMGGNHTLTNCSAWDNKARGFTNNSGSNSSCSGCTSCANGTSGDQGVSGITTSGCPTGEDRRPQHRRHDSEGRAEFSTGRFAAARRSFFALVRGDAPCTTRPPSSP